jgi:hypothetical protein
VEENMTKTVRIENADTGTAYHVRVTTQERLYNHETQALSPEWTDTNTRILSYPTEMLSDYLTNSKRFLIEEVSKD